jgi:hypothetical protein
LGYAVLLRAPSSGDATRVAELLRADPISLQIALVLTGKDVHRLRKNSESDAVATSARLLADRWPDLPFADIVRALAAAREDEAPWLRLPAECVLIVPRLSALATPERFA